MITLTQCDMKRSVQLNPNTQMYFLYYWEQDINSQMTTINNGNTTTVVRKGGCGFGSFVNVLGKVVSQTGIGQTGNTVGNVTGQVATRSIVAATSNVKPPFNYRLKFLPLETSSKSWVIFSCVI